MDIVVSLAFKAWRLAGPMITALIVHFFKPSTAKTGGMPFFERYHGRTVPRPHWKQCLPLFRPARVVSQRP